MLFAFVPMALAGFFLVIAVNDQITFLYGVAGFFALIPILMAMATYQTHGKRDTAHSHLDRIRRWWL